MIKRQLHEVYPFVKGDDVVLNSDDGPVLKMTVKDFLALADEVRKRNDPVSKQTV